MCGWSAVRLPVDGRGWSKIARNRKNRKNYARAVLGIILATHCHLSKIIDPIQNYRCSMFAVRSRADCAAFVQGLLGGQKLTSGCQKLSSWARRVADVCAACARRVPFDFAEFRGVGHIRGRSRAAHNCENGRENAENVRK